MKGTALAPSQHIRPTDKTRTARTAWVAVVLLGATLALSDCGTQQPGAAAIVDGAAISDKDVQTVALQLDTKAKDQQKLPPGDVLLYLIAEPYIVAEAKRAGKTVSDAQVRQEITKVAKVAEPAPATIEFVRSYLSIQLLDDAAKASMLANLGKAKVTVSPRYGTFDPQKGLVPVTPNWIKATASPVAK